MSKRILLISFRGQVGAELHCALQPLGEVIAIDRRSNGQPMIDLSKPDSIVDAIQTIKPDIIVNAAAYTAVDQAEQETDLAQQINGQAPGILAEQAKALNALLVHYSTDYVFDGNAQQAYSETDTTNPQSVYGGSKLAGDNAIQAVDCDHLILRTSWVYGLRGRNFLLTMQRLATERDELRIVADQIGAPTWSRLIAEITAQMLAQLNQADNPLHQQDVRGVYHLSSAGETNWYEFAKAIFHTQADAPRVLPIKTEAYPTPASRPAYSVLNNDKLASTFNLHLPAWDQALSVCLARQILA